MSIHRLILQISIAGHHSSRGQTLNREDDFQLLAVSVQEMMSLSLEEFTTWLQIHLLKLESSFSARNDDTVIRGVHYVATDISTETRKVEGKLDSLVNLLTQLACSQMPASVARVCGIRSFNDHHTNVCPSSYQPGVNELLDAYAPNINSRSPQQQRQERWLPTLSNFSARNDVIVIRGVHDVATDTSVETRKVEGKLDALVNFVTQLAVSQKPASFAIVWGIRSSIDHHTNVCPSSKQPVVHEHPEAYAANIYSRPPQRQRPNT
ncbi:hypothetical protein Fmac_024881 [Flemingia macrophylla]|uniref:Uncharacterized protein n=1 Tax=Flemingia macrophylla TaxID=520843 RepID=A0ABD1LQR5_9FABA